MKVYIAVPLFSEGERAFNEKMMLLSGNAGMRLSCRKGKAGVLRTCLL